MKGFLSWHNVQFGKTHNLVELGQACVRVDVTLESIMRPAAPLTEYAWRFRYPGDLEMPPPGEAEGALAVAREAYGALVSRLPPEVKP